MIIILLLLVFGITPTVLIWFFFFFKFQSYIVSVQLVLFEHLCCQHLVIIFYYLFEFFLWRFSSIHSHDDFHLHFFLYISSCCVVQRARKVISIWVSLIYFPHEIFFSNNRRIYIYFLNIVKILYFIYSNQFWVLTCNLDSYSRIFLITPKVHHIHKSNFSSISK